MATSSGWSYSHAKKLRDGVLGEIRLNMASNIIYNPEKFHRKVSFANLPHVGRCSPSDIDFFMEINQDQRFMIGDFKEQGKQLEDGQKWLLENAVNAFEEYGYASIAFLAWHGENDMLVDAASAMVAAFYSRGGWVESTRFRSEEFIVLYKGFFRL